ncbi:MAG: protein kinase [Blastocatellia bacterium]|nr:protein kinase [Blastocatellia bacterium]
MKFCTRFFILGLCLFWHGIGLVGQAQTAVNPEIGQRFIQNYSRDDYDAATQNWVMAQDQRGVMYFGNNDGVLEYDGVQWHLIPVANGSTVRSLARDKDGRMYVGAQNEFGFLAPTPTGALRYQSLSQQLKEDDRQCSDVWNTTATPDGVYFQARNLLYWWDRKQLHLIRPQVEKSTFQYTCRLGDDFFVLEANQGLFRLKGETREPVQGGELFAAKRICAMHQVTPTQVMLATREDGLFFWDGRSFVPGPAETSRFLVDQQLYKASLLPDGRVAFATKRSGVVIVFPDGRMAEIISKTTGLGDDLVWNVFTDRSGALWVALNNGMARIEAVSPLSFFDERAGLKGSVQAIRRFQKKLYVATALGMFALNPESGAASGWTPVTGLSSQCWWLEEVGGHLLVAAADGVFEITGTAAKKVVEVTDAFCLTASVRVPGRVYLGLRTGLSQLVLEGQTWKNQGPVEGITGEVRTIVETAEGTLWVGTLFDGVYRVEGQTAPFKVTQFTEKNGLPQAADNYVNLIQGRAVVASKTGVLSFETETGRFDADPALGRVAGTGALFRLQEDQAGNIWTNNAQKIILVRQPDGRYVREDRWLQWLPKGDIQVFYPEANGIVWIGSIKGLYRMDTAFPKTYTSEFQALVRRVVAGKDQILFEGTEGAGVALGPEVSYGNNRLRFECSAVSFEREKEGNSYQFQLIGVDQDWSDWTREPFKEYTNLWEGGYRLRVRCKNLYGTVTQDAVYAFRIKAPWYRQWWALVGYLVLFSGLSYGGVQWRLEQLRERNRLLEETVQKRTAQLAEKNQELDSKNVELDSKNVELASKIEAVKAAEQRTEQKNQELSHALFNLRLAQQETEQKNQELDKKNAELDKKNLELDRKIGELHEKNAELLASQQRADRIFSALAEALPGTVLEGKYRLDEKIGAGGFGAVFRATHLALSREVAVKVFRPSPGNDSAEAVERFRLEGISAGRLNHPNAIQVLDSGISQEGIAFLVMELLKGGSLHETLRRQRRLPLKRVTEILLPVCSALAEAHRLNIVHRDIKPDNIFLHQTSEGEVVKVVDFGIAKMVGDGADEKAANLTGTSGIIGTPTYMAPERLTNRPYDGRSDVYSLGIMVYEMLTGHFPFEADFSDYLSVAMAHLQKEPVSLRLFNGNIPAAVETVVLQALAKNAEERPTVTEFAEAFSLAAQPHLDSQPGTLVSDLPTGFLPDMETVLTGRGGTQSNVGHESPTVQAAGPRTKEELQPGGFLADMPTVMTNAQGLRGRDQGGETVQMGSGYLPGTPDMATVGIASPQFHQLETVADQRNEAKDGLEDQPEEEPGLADQPTVQVSAKAIERAELEEMSTVKFEKPVLPAVPPPKADG